MNKYRKCKAIQKVMERNLTASRNRKRAHYILILEVFMLRWPRKITVVQNKFTLMLAIAHGNVLFYKGSIARQR